MKLLLKLYAKVVLTDGEPKGNILMFANLPNLGIGNIVWMYHTMSALEKFGLTVVIDHEEMRRIIAYNLPSSEVVSFDKIPNRQYGTSISNFVVQTKKNAKKIIDLRIPCRIGHNLDDRYEWLFSHLARIHSGMSEFEMNARLAEPFGVKVTKQKINLPPTTAKHDKFDVLIQPHTQNEERRNYLEYGAVINRLGLRVGLIGSSKEYNYCQDLADSVGAENLCGMSIIDTCYTAKRAKLVIGNDGGLIKLINACGVKTLQIHRENSPYYWRSKIDDTDLIEPTVSDVVEKAIEIMNDKAKQ